MPGVVDDARDMLVLDSGRVGEGSLDANGDGAADDEVEAPDACEVSFDGHESVLGVIVAVLEVDSRDSGGNGAWAALLGERERAASGEPFATLDDLSMFARIQGLFRGRPAGEEWRLDSADGTCQGLS